MIFYSTHISGQKRGHEIGFPTINLAIPSDLVLDDGIYAVWATIGSKVYKGALHYGPIPTFDQKEKTMEVHLLNVTDETAPDTNDVTIEIDVVEYIRDIRTFEIVEDLAEQIAQDVEKAEKILK